MVIQWRLYVGWISMAVAALSSPAMAQCVDYSKDPAGCQPSTFDTPIGQMPSVRVNRDGKLDPTSSEEDARAGVAKLEKDLHLFRNIEHLHWVITVPSVKDPATGAWKGGDLDAAGDGRGLGIAGNCIFTGHANGAGRKHAINIFKIQPNPEKQPPVQVGEIPAMFEGNQGFDDRELRSLVYKTSKGEDRYILVRNAGTNTIGRMRDVQHRHEYLSADREERDHRLRRPVPRVLPLARSREFKPRAGLHDQLDLRTCRIPTIPV